MAVLNRGWRNAVIVVLALVCLVSVDAVSADNSALEYAVKANYLVKFAPFVELKG